MSGFYLETENRVCTPPKGNVPPPPQKKKFHKVNLNLWNCNSSSPPHKKKKNSAQIKPRFLAKTALESNRITSILGVIETTHIHIHMFM